MVTYGLNYDVRPGREAEFEAGFRGVMDALRGFPGHRESRLYRDVLSPQSYLVYSEWESREAFAGFLQSEAFASTKTWGREEILAGRPRHLVIGEREA
jgi:heme-degrading monooxygenase HmoA